MPAFLDSTHDLAVKIVNVYPRNAELDLPTIHALVVESIPVRVGRLP